MAKYYIEEVSINFHGDKIYVNLLVDGQLIRKLINLETCVSKSETTLLNNLEKFIKRVVKDVMDAKEEDLPDIIIDKLK